MTTSPILTMENVTRLHTDGPRTIAALDNVSLSVAPGELVAVMGPSGSGKSTLLNVAGTLDTPNHGHIIINGRDTAGLSRTERAAIRRRDVGFVFQHYNLVPTLTVAENVALPLELDNVPRREARAAALAALEGIDQADLADRFPAEISGGQAQRVAIARALVGERSLLLADEPTGALDTTTAESVMALLRSRIDAGAAGLLVTHEPRFAAYADRTVWLRDGQLVQPHAGSDAR
ncbi:ABC transporter ATP-binding protein [Corynebacterium pygosceleis]|uniref:ABC transporter ATP-binding protein n=1 Tax=Corynebacterium pygosceleis TaxID=2800406 RepID=A0A9Q4GLH5_9CORY|nr:ABC transporter ATP-binding protein [Corynebacterium pygosceleis]MCK7637292.1 ABC transporter ATP-binding protein [Corynebacterium pygosceleis]MCK7675942.1 ABC transporter ATP-binding protein [Corynebacterium pygosceleis]MCL0119932.1 ABC transporter ATP-binding protein [Corynebacterium pygosceleis]MCX7445195.1 ABC transporter ATP-binding protein [Corynebacterium pygosceleis]MCX7468380.1 ABC transporter ATP-binding protein [Corynebacterium pygosceleis]